MAAVRRRHPPGLAFGAFAVGAGAFYVMVSVLSTPSRLLVPGLALAGVILLWAAGVCGLFLLVPTRLARSDRRDAITAGVLGVVVGVVYGVILLLMAPSDVFPWKNLGAFETTALWSMFIFADASFAAAALVFPLRMRRLSASERSAARSLAILAVGVYLFIAGTVGGIVRAARGDVPLVIGALDAAFVLLPLLLWIRATRGPHGRTARNVVLAVALILIGSLLVNASAADFAYPLGRILGAILLAYAVLRGQIDGLDLKIRFAISKSTVAAMFIAVFFIASEGAQLIFGRENPWVGLAAAGALVFVLAPLQRAADRLALKAVPATATTVREAAGGREDAYRAAVRMALRGGIQRDEEYDLARLARELGIDAHRALQLRDEVQGNASGRAL